MQRVPLTAGQLNRATLDRQLLLQRRRLGVVSAVERVVALQAQESASPYLALWNRVAGFDPAELDAAYADQEIVKATLMRITLHAVALGDYPSFHRGMQETLRASGLNDRRFKTTDLSVGDADALAPELVEFATEPRTTAEIEAWLTDRLGAVPEPGVWRALRMFSPLVHAPTGGAWAFGRRPSYVAAPVAAAPANGDESLQRLIIRYLEGFGPASVRDVAQFGLLRQSSIRPAVAALGDALVRVDGPDGADLLDVPGATVPSADSAAPPRLLPMWDSILLAYADRSRIIPDDYRKVVIRRNGDVLPTLLVDGHVAGVWRPLDGGIEARAFHRLPDAAWDGLAVEAGALLELLAGRDPATYGRYRRWWSDLHAAEVRRLPG